MRFDNGDLVQFDSKKNGKGKGAVVGYYKSSNKDMWIVYPQPKKNIPKSLRRKWMCFLAEESELISAPF